MTATRHATLDGSPAAGERPLRVCLAHPYTWPEVRRGGERYLDDLAWWLAGRGHRVEVLTSGPGDGVLVGDGRVTARAVPLVPPGRRAERLGLSPDDRFGLRILPELMRRRYDVVHALVPAAALAARATGQQVVYTVLGHPTARAMADLPTHRRMLKAAARAATVAAGLSAASKASVAELFGVEAEVLSPGVRLDRFPLAGAARTGPPLLLFPSLASDPRKRLDVLLRAFARLLERRPDARLALVGPGDPAWALTGVPPERRQDVEAALDRPGAVEDLAAWYRKATVTVLPSVEEAFGLVLLESLASGTPVVCAADGGMPEIACDPAVSRTFVPDDDAALAGALEDAVNLAADPATPARCAEHARRWGWDESAGPAHEHLYRRLVDARRAGVVRRRLLDAVALRPRGSGR